MKRLNLDTEDNSTALGYKSEAEFMLAMDKCSALIQHTKTSCSEVRESTEEGTVVAFNAAQFADILISEMEKDEGILPLVMLRFARLLAESESEVATRPAGRLSKLMGSAPKEVREAIKKGMLAALIEREQSAEDVMHHKCDECKGSEKNGGDCPVEGAIRTVQAKIISGEVASGKEAIRSALAEAAKNSGL